MALVAQPRVAGTAVEGAFYGYQPLALVISATGGFLVDTVDGEGVITKRGFSKTVEVVETFGSIVWLGAQGDDSFACIVDGPSFNKSDEGDYADLIAAVTEVRDGSANVTVAEYNTLDSDGGWSLVQ
jgi:hypothetical protein